MYGHTKGHNGVKQPNRVPPTPNRDSILLWTTLAQRYGDEPAVLFDLLNEPILITVTLFSLAMINVLTKKTATISGSLFTLGFFLFSRSPSAGTCCRCGSTR